MAETGYGCVFGDCTNQVGMIITWLTNGHTVSLCAEHFGPGMIPLLAVELGVEPGPFYGSIERYQARELKKAERAQADAHAATAAEDSQGPQPPAGEHTKADADADGAEAEALALEAERERAEP